MKSIKVLSALSLLALAGAAQAEVTGSMGIASSYLWRGLDLGSGTPAVSGDLKFSESGFYTGIWGSSGDTANGTEYDLYAGYGGAAGAVTYDISYWTYSYPTGLGLKPFDLAEVVGSLGVGPVTASMYYNVADPAGNDGDYKYYTLKAKFGAFTALLGQHDGGADDLSHFDLSYAYNDNLSFTISAPIDSDSGNEADPTFVASYSVPFGK